MTEEEIKALKERIEAKEKEAQEALKKAEELEQVASKREEDLTKVVDELKEIRKQKAEAEEKLKLSNGGQDIDTLLSEALEKREKERAQNELKEAIEEFRKSKPEFQADAAGLVFDKFKSNMNKFNLSDVKNKQEAKERLEEIYDFTKRKDSGGQSDGEGYEGSPRSQTPPAPANPQMKEEDKRAIELSGMSEERLAEIRKKYPEALESLGIN